MSKVIPHTHAEYLCVLYPVRRSQPKLGPIQRESEEKTHDPSEHFFTMLCLRLKFLNYSQARGPRRMLLSYLESKQGENNRVKLE